MREIKGKKKRRYLVVIDLNMKKLGVLEKCYVEFKKKCYKKNIIVDFILPCMPASIVMAELSSTPGEIVSIDGLHNKLRDLTFKECIRAALLAWKMANNHRYDIATFVFFDFFAMLVARILTYGSIRSFIWHQHSELIHNPTKNIVLNLLKKNFSTIRIASLFIDSMCGCSNVVKNQIIDKKVNPKKVHYIYNGLDFRTFDNIATAENVEKISKEFDVSRRWPILICVAGLVPVKGVEYFIRAMPKIVSKYPKTLALMIGEGPLHKELYLLAKELNISDHVIFTGYRTDVYAIMKIATVIVQPSLRESFGNTIIEGMYAGKPVIASNVGGIPEIIRENVEDLLTIPGDHVDLSKKILNLLSNQKKIEDFSIRNKINITKFTLENMGKEYMEYYMRY